MLKYFVPMFRISGYLNSLIQLICDFFIRKLSPQTYQQLHDPSTTKPLIETEPVQQSPWPAQPNNLISNANHMAEADFNFTIKQ